MAPFRPAASCVLSAEGVDDRKSIELSLSLHTNDFIPLSNVCVRAALDYQSNLGPDSTLRAITKGDNTCQKAQPPRLPFYLISSFLFHLPSSNHKYIGKFYLLQGC